MGKNKNNRSRSPAENPANKEAASLNQLFENSPQAIVVIDKFGNVVRVNQEFSITFGYLQEEITGKPLDEFTAPRGFQLEAKSIISKVCRGERIDLESQRKHADGSTSDVAITGIPILIDGRAEAAYIIYENITKRKEKEKYLQISRDRYHAIFEGSRDAIFISDTNSRFVDVNHAAAELTGYSKDELKKMKIPDLHDEMDLGSYKKYFDQIMDGKDIISEAKIKRKDGTKVDAEFSNKRIFIGNAVYMHTLARNITQRKQAEAKIKSALKEKEVMLKEIHHRVKNNLQIVSSLIRLQTAGVKDETLQRMRRKLQQRIRSMALVHEKLYQSKDLAKINLAEYIKSLTNYLLQSHEISSKPIKIHYQMEDISIDINNAIPCGLIVNEWVSNAFIHAFPESEEGNVAIRLRKHKADSKDRIKLTVEDNGIGFSTQNKPGSRNSLGLVLVSDLASQINGTVTQDKTREKGTAFTLLF